MSTNDFDEYDNYMFEIEGVIFYNDMENDQLYRIHEFKGYIFLELIDS